MTLQSSLCFIVALVLGTSLLDPVNHGVHRLLRTAIPAEAELTLVENQVLTCMFVEIEFYCSFETLSRDIQEFKRWTLPGLWNRHKDTPFPRKSKIAATRTDGEDLGEELRAYSL